MIAKKQFLSVKCNSEYVAWSSEEANADGFESTLDGYSGYLLANGILIPYSFVEQVDDELQDRPIEYGYVLCEADLFRPKFLESLDELEREALLPAVMYLIAQGKFGFQFFGAEMEAA